MCPSPYSSTAPFDFILYATFPLQFLKLIRCVNFLLIFEAIKCLEKKQTRIGNIKSGADGVENTHGQTPPTPSPPPPEQGPKFCDSSPDFADFPRFLRLTSGKEAGGPGVLMYGRNRLRKSDLY